MNFTVDQIMTRFHKPPTYLSFGFQNAQLGHQGPQLQLLQGAEVAHHHLPPQGLHDVTWPLTFRHQHVTSSGHRYAVLLQLRAVQNQKRKE